MAFLKTVNFGQELCFVAVLVVVGYLTALWTVRNGAKGKIVITAWPVTQFQFKKHFKDKCGIEIYIDYFCGLITVLLFFAVVYSLLL